MDHYNELAALFEGPDAGLFKPPEKRHIATADERLIDSFKQIEDFVRRNNRLPEKDAATIKEKMLRARLDGIRTDRNKVDALQDVDELGLLEEEKAPESLDELFGNDGWLFNDNTGIFDMTGIPKERREVRNAAKAEKRKKCEDFEKYEPLFKEQQNLLGAGARKLVFFRNVDQLQPGNFYVYDGLMCYVVSFDEKERKAGGYSQQRITVIFENGTESHMYRRSLAQRLYEGGTIVVDANHANVDSATDNVTGYIYVLKSLSTDPKVTTIKDFYKIGQTSGTVADRIKNAEVDPTYLMAPVEIVDTYRLSGDLNPERVEHLLHKFFSDAKVELEMIDTDGHTYIPEEWYSVPLSAVNEAVDLLRTGEITDYIYKNGEIVHI